MKITWTSSGHNLYSSENNLFVFKLGLFTIYIHPFKFQTIKLPLSLMKINLRFWAKTFQPSSPFPFVRLFKKLPIQNKTYFGALVFKFKKITVASAFIRRHSLTISHVEIFINLLIMKKVHFDLKTDGAAVLLDFLLSLALGRNDRISVPTSLH